MEAKRISQRAVKNMINGNTALLHIGNFDTGKRTNLKRAYGIPLTEEQGAKELDWIKSFVGKNIYRYKDIEIIKKCISI